MSGAAGLVIDSSALVAPILGERGGEVVAEALAGAGPVVLSAVNLTETGALLARRHGVQAREALADILTLGVEVVPFGPEEAAQTAPLLAAHRGVLSLGDAACFATVLVRGLPVLTADRAWSALGVPVDLRSLR